MNDCVCKIERYLKPLTPGEVPRNEAERALSAFLPLSQLMLTAPPKWEPFN